MGQKTSQFKQAKIEALAALDVPSSEIAKVTDTNIRTVQRILADHRGYEDPETMLMVRDQIKQVVEKKAYGIAEKLLNQVEAETPNAKARDAAVAYGILRQHARLDAGEATENIEVHQHGLDASLSGTVSSTLERIKKIKLKDVTIKPITDKVED